MDVLRNEIAQRLYVNEISFIWYNHHQGGVQPNVYTQFEDQKLPRGFMPMEFRISVLVLCTTN